MRAGQIVACAPPPLPIEIIREWREHECGFLIGACVCRLSRGFARFGEIGMVIIRGEREMTAAKAIEWRRMYICVAFLGCGASVCRGNKKVGFWLRRILRVIWEVSLILYLNNTLLCTSEMVYNAVLDTENIIIISKMRWFT